MLRPWLLLLSLALLNLLGMADRYLLLSFSPHIIADLQLSLFEFSLLTGFIFTLPYSLFGIYAGVLADRMHRPRLVAAGLFVWSLLTALTGAVGSFASMAASRVLIGAGEAVLTPSALTMISDYVPQARRSLAIAIYYLALPLGVGASFLFAASAGEVIGWRGSFALMGALGILATVVVLRLPDPIRDQVIAAEKSEATDHRNNLKSLYAFSKKTPAFPLIVLGVTACGFVQGSTVLDLLWWTQERGFQESQAQGMAGLVLLGGGIAGAIAGGFGADFCQQRWHAGRLKFLLGSLLIAVPLMVLYRLIAADTLLFPMLAFIVIMSGNLMYGPAYAAVQDLVPSNMRGTATAVLVLFMSLAGVSAGAACVGALAELFRAWAWLQPISHAVQMTQLVGLIALPAFAAAIYCTPRQQKKFITPVGRLEQWQM